jgi:hypothetical protein
MKMRLLKKYIPLIICLFVLQTDFAFAQGDIAKIFAFTGIVELADSVVAIFANMAMTVASWLLIAAGYILDISIQLTLNIKGFVKATPAIFTVWKSLRDITGLFFIFYLLYAAIQMMTGWGKESYGSTIKNIVIAGVLINFSFFIVSFGIDVSNITSQALYGAMVPNKVIVKIDENASIQTLVSNAGKSDISNIFMNTLRIQSIYDTKGNKLGTEIGNPIKTTLIGITGVIMMITTAASFILAALAFIARLVILLFLLAFSSIWFASMVIPQLKEAGSKFQGALMSQLLFMPAYLLLMYVALSIINGSTIFRAGVIDGAAAGITGSNWIMPYIILLVNFAIIIFILNLPLVVALSMGGYATSWFKGSIDKWDALKVWRNVGGWAKDNAWRGTGGRVASTLAKSEGLKNIAAKSKFGELVLKGVRGAGGSYDKKLAEQVEARTKFAESLGANEGEIIGIKKKYRSLIENALTQEKRARSMGDTVAADRYKAYAENLKKQLGVDLVNKQKERQVSYAERISDPGILSTYPNLWTKVARKDKVAAAKINIDVWQKQLDKKKEAVTKIKQDLERIKTDIRREKAARGGVVSKINEDEQNKLEQKLKEATTNPSHGGDVDAMGTDDLQDLIDQEKLTK